MKIIAIGDIHGMIDWERIVFNAEFDKVVFVGDYFDTHRGISPIEQILNFEKILEYKKSDSSKVVLLFGNHDFHYMKSCQEKYSGFQYTHFHDISDLIHKALNEGLMRMCFKHDNYIFSHAGITKTWLKNAGYTGEVAIDTFVNDIFKYKPYLFNFSMGCSLSPYGDDICHSPIWVRPDSLRRDSLDGYIQVVGHTTQDRLKIDEGNIVLIDTLGTSREFLEIDNGKMTVLDSKKYLKRAGKYTPDKITSLLAKEVFVFGSNLAGKHGTGAAKTALKWGAKYGEGVGLQGSTYAIPTRDVHINTLPLSEIKKYVDDFTNFAKQNGELTFLVTQIGCGLAGYKPIDIAPLFKQCIDIGNVILPKNFTEYKVIDIGLFNTVGAAVAELKSSGELVCGDYNGVILYSDVDDTKSARLKINEKEK